MEYQIEELLPIVTNLVRKYTSNESSSIPYETARMLMEAVIYCINECYENSEITQVLEGDKLKSELAYDKGYQYVIEKVLKSKEIYERIIENFEDYGCRNYRDTIIKGIPGFFMRYDAKFNPQDHILTLDYPTLFMNFDKCGVDLMFEYLTEIELEKRFLDLFGREAVVQLLERIQPEYQSLYLDNICYAVLFNAIECVIAEKPLQKLELSQQDFKDIEFYFKGDTLEKVELKIKNIIGIITDKMADDEVQIYLKKASKEYAVRIWNNLQNGSL